VKRYLLMLGLMLGVVAAGYAMDGKCCCGKEATCCAKQCSCDDCGCDKCGKQDSGSKGRPWPGHKR